MFVIGKIYHQNTRSTIDFTLDEQWVCNVVVFSRTNNIKKNYMRVKNACYFENARRSSDDNIK